MSKKNVVCCGSTTVPAPAFLRVKRAGMKISPLESVKCVASSSVLHPTSHEVENYGTSYPINSLLAKIVGPEPMGNQHLPRFLEEASQ